MRFLVAALLLAGCGGMPPMAVAEQCQSASGLTIQLESVPAGTTGLCAWTASMADGLRSVYEGRWGPLELSGWTVRIRTAANFNGEHLGTTWPEAHTIDLVDGQWVVFPHELHHVAVGMGHDGWCPAFEPWERSELGLDERAYLGCP